MFGGGPGTVLPDRLAVPPVTRRTQHRTRKVSRGRLRPISKCLADHPRNTALHTSVSDKRATGVAGLRVAGLLERSRQRCLPGARVRGELQQPWSHLSHPGCVRYRCSDDGYTVREVIKQLEERVAAT